LEIPFPINQPPVDSSNYKFQITPHASRLK
jgi:hypothetical protein